MEIANQMNIIEVKQICQESENEKNIKVIQFARISNPIQVLCWVQIDTRTNTYEV